MKDWVEIRNLKKHNP